MWRSYTPVGKLETAYHSAEAAAPGGGQRMLALLSRSLAQEYEPVRSDPALSGYIERDAGNSPLAFATLDPKDDDHEKSDHVPPEARRAIEAMTHYCDDGGFGPRTVMTECFGLDHQQADQILSTSRTHQQALERAYLATPKEYRDIAMRTLVVELDENYESARGVQEFDLWRRPETAADRGAGPVERGRLVQPEPEQSAAARAPTVANPDADAVATPPGSHARFRTADYLPPHSHARAARQTIWWSERLLLAVGGFGAVVPSTKFGKLG